MTDVIGESVEFIYCGCKCGFTRSKYNSQGKEVRFINGHAWIGRKHSEETKRKSSEQRKGKCMGKDNPTFGRKHTLEERKKMSEVRKGKILGAKLHNWKGDNVGYDGLHDWVRRYLPQPELCQLCNLIPPRDLANITGIYNREFKNWAFFCHKCHLYYDNIIERNLRPTMYKKKDAK